MSRIDDKFSEAADGIPLVDLIYALLEHWRVLVALPVIVALGTWGLVSRHPGEWEARVILDVETAGITKIESMPRLLNRLQLRGTRARAGQILGLARDGQDKERLINFIAVSQIKNTGQAELKVRAVSREDAEKQVLAVTQVVQEGYLKEAKEILRVRKGELGTVETQIRTYRERSKTPKNIPERSTGKKGQFAVADVASLKTRAHQLRSEIAKLQILVKIHSNSPTKLLDGAVSVSLYPLVPRPELFVMTAVLAGLSAALLFAVIFHALRHIGKNAETTEKLSRIK